MYEGEQEKAAKAYVVSLMVSAWNARDGVWHQDSAASWETRFAQLVQEVAALGCEQPHAGVRLALLARVSASACAWLGRAVLDEALRDASRVEGD